MSKPKPPVDLWEQMDAIREQNDMSAPPPDAFTTKEYAERYGLGDKTAELQLKKLCSTGTVTRIGLRGRNVYYQLAN